MSRINEYCNGKSLTIGHKTMFIQHNVYNFDVYLFHYPFILGFRIMYKQMTNVYNNCSRQTLNVTTEVTIFTTKKKHFTILQKFPVKMVAC